MRKLKTKKVFISYAHDTLDTADKVLELANYFRSQGIDANIDQYEESPREGWARWMDNQIKSADYVLVLATKTYEEKMSSKSAGKGVTWEAGIIYQYLYDANGNNTKFIPIYFDSADIKFIPTPIKAYTHYDMSTDKGKQKLCNRIKGIISVKKPDILPDPALDMRDRKTMFVGSDIDLEAWDKAEWRGVATLLNPYDHSDVIVGLLFHGDAESARKIFQDWRKDGAQNNDLVLEFVKGGRYWMAETYTCIIHTSMEAWARRMKAHGVDPEKAVYLAFSRMQTMHPKDNFAGYNKMQENCILRKEMKVIPITIEDPNKKHEINNFIPHYDCVVATKNFEFHKANELTEDMYIYQVFRGYEEQRKGE